MALTKEERFVQALFRERYGLQLVEIPTEEGKRTPDFNVLSQGAKVAVMEVKTLTDTLQGVPVEGINSLSEDELARNSVSDDKLEDAVGQRLYAATKQLKRYARPRVVLILDDNVHTDVHDLRAVLQGYLEYDGGLKVSQLSPSVRERIARPLRVLDLCLWLERHDESLGAFWTTNAGREFKERHLAPPPPPPR